MAENSERKVLNRKVASVAICRLNPAFAIADVRFVERVQKSPICKIQLRASAGGRQHSMSCFGCPEHPTYSFGISNNAENRSLRSWLR